MKTPEEVRNAMRELLVPRLSVVLDLAEEAIEEWRKGRGEGEDPAYTGELPLSERLMLAQMCVNIMGQAALEDLRKQGPAGQPEDPAASPEAPPPPPRVPLQHRVAPPLTAEQMRDLEKAMGKTMQAAGMILDQRGAPTPEMLRDAEKTLGEVMESVGMTEAQWEAIEEFLRCDQHGNVVLHVIMAGR